VGLPYAVILGLDCITGLQSARLLAARGVPVIGIVADPRHFCSRTRVCDRIVRSPLAGPALVRTLERLGPSLENGGVLIPCTDLSMLAVVQHGEPLRQWYRFVLPDPQVVLKLMDKVLFAQHATAANLAIPTTRILASRADAERAAGDLRYPAVL
jgi:D-aspartate ligase